jgi:hypothetical protein
MRKIILLKGDSLDMAKEKLSRVEGGFVIISAPKDCDAVSSVRRISSLKDFASQMDVTIFIESVDEEVLSRAEEAGVEAVHPFLVSPVGNGVSDIVPLNLKEEQEERDNQEEAEEDDRPKVIRAHKAKVADEAKKVFFESAISHEQNSRRADAGQYQDDSRRRLPWRKIMAVIIPLVVIWGGVFSIDKFMSKGSVVIVLKRIPWAWNGAFIASTGNFDSASTTSSTAKISAEIFSEKKNMTQIYKGSEEKRVEQKAKGTITIFNAYSSASQPLVATTRFMTEDGRIYRLVQAITVPGAKVADGKITPSSIQAEVIADSAGEKFNTENKEKLSIPGFKGTPKYNSFYGEVASIKGGYVGVRMVPTAQEVEDAKKKTAELLTQALLSSISAEKGDEFKIFSAGNKVNIVRLEANTNVDEDGKFSVFAEGEAKVFGIKESDVSSILLKNAIQDASEANQSVPDPRLEVSNLEYKDIAPNFEDGVLKFTVTVSADLVAGLDIAKLTENLAGLSEDKVKSAVGSSPAIKEANLSFWPFWSNSMPQNPSRIKIQAK